MPRPRAGRSRRPRCGRSARHQGPRATTTTWRPRRRGGSRSRTARSARSRRPSCRHGRRRSCPGLWGRTTPRTRPQRMAVWRAPMRRRGMRAPRVLGSGAHGDEQRRGCSSLAAMAMRMVTRGGEWRELATALLPQRRGSSGGKGGHCAAHSCAVARSPRGGRRQARSTAVMRSCSKVGVAFCRPSTLLGSPPKTRPLPMPTSPTRVDVAQRRGDAASGAPPGREIMSVSWTFARALSALEEGPSGRGRCF